MFFSKFFASLCFVALALEGILTSELNQYGQGFGLEIIRISYIVAFSATVMLNHDILGMIPGIAGETTDQPNWQFCRMPPVAFETGALLNFKIHKCVIIFLFHLSSLDIITY